MTALFFWRPVTKRRALYFEFVTAASRLSGPFYFAFRHFQVLSNDLLSTKLLVCPADVRQPAPDFVSLQNGHLSYVFNVAAEAG